MRTKYATFVRIEGTWQFNGFYTPEPATAAADLAALKDAYETEHGEGAFRVLEFVDESAPAAGSEMVVEHALRDAAR
jgi:hypothetical protein